MLRLSLARTAPPLPRLFGFGFGFALALLLLLLLLLLCFCCCFVFDLPGPLGAADPTGEYPKGGAQDVRRFSLAHGCAIEKCPLGLRTRSAQRGGRAAGCAFFWLLFFAQAKKSNSPQGESFVPLPLPLP
ncbi:hypothetical protein GGR77_003719 [Xanthomonas translucens]